MEDYHIVCQKKGEKERGGGGFVLVANALLQFWVSSDAMCGCKIVNRNHTTSEGTSRCYIWQEIQ